MRGQGDLLELLSHVEGHRTPGSELRAFMRADAPCPCCGEVAPRQRLESDHNVQFTQRVQDETGRWYTRLIPGGVGPYSGRCTPMRVSQRYARLAAQRAADPGKRWDFNGSTRCFAHHTRRGPDCPQDCWDADARETAARATAVWSGKAWKDGGY